MAVWRTVWEQKEHLICRVKHRERLVEYQDQQGQWVQVDVQRARQRLKLVATAQAEMVACRGRQRRTK